MLMDLLLNVNQSAASSRIDFQSIIQISLQIVTDVTKAVTHLKVVGSQKNAIRESH